jgi:SAM-dependent methyltransferase
VVRIETTGVRLKTADLQGRFIALNGEALFTPNRFVDSSGIVRWPIGLHLRLPELSATRISLLGPRADEEEFVIHDFGGARRWSGEVDTWGRPLRINKWGWFGIELRDRSDAEKAAALSDAQQLVSELDAWGTPAWIVGGTLLGAVRNGRLIDHDDDIDLAYLANSQDPHDVALESFQIEHLLANLGWRTLRFTGAHFQATRVRSPEAPGIHIDIFSAFFSDDLINQPFHIRGPFAREQLLPLRRVTLQGVDLPAPRDIDGWLTLNYGDRWRTPDPGHRLVTPATTRWLFSGWFGQYLQHYEYWTDRYGRVPPPTPPPASACADWLLSRLAPGTPVIELGCGLGADARVLADNGYPVLATDYASVSGNSLELPEQGLKTARLNAADPRDLMRVAAAARIRGRPVHVHSRNVMEQLQASARRDLLNAFLLFPPGSTFSMSVRVGQRANDTGPDPNAWRLDLSTVRQEGVRAGLSWQPQGGEPGTSGNVMFWGSQGVDTKGRRWMATIPRSLKDLKTEISRWRRIPLRLAEVQALLVAQLADSGKAESVQASPPPTSEAGGSGLDSRH